MVTTNGVRFKHERATLPSLPMMMRRCGLSYDAASMSFTLLIVHSVCLYLQFFGGYRKPLQAVLVMYKLEHFSDFPLKMVDHIQTIMFSKGKDVVDVGARAGRELLLALLQVWLPEADDI